MRICKPKNHINYIYIHITLIIIIRVGITIRVTLGLLALALLLCSLPFLLLLLIVIFLCLHLFFRAQILFLLSFIVGLVIVITAIATTIVIVLLFLVVFLLLLFCLLRLDKLRAIFGELVAIGVDEANGLITFRAEITVETALALVAGSTDRLVLVLVFVQITSLCIGRVNLPSSMNRSTRSSLWLSCFDVPQHSRRVFHLTSP